MQWVCIFLAFRTVSKAGMFDFGETDLRNRLKQTLQQTPHFCPTTWREGPIIYDRYTAKYWKFLWCVLQCSCMNSCVVRCDFFKGCLIGFNMSIFQNRDQEASANASAIVHHLSQPRWRRPRRLSVHQNSSFLWQKALPTLAMRLVERHHVQMLHMLRSVQTDFVGFISIVFRCFAISWYELHFFQLRDWVIEQFVIFSAPAIPVLQQSFPPSTISSRNQWQVRKCHQLRNHRCHRSRQSLLETRGQGHSNTTG